MSKIKFFCMAIFVLSIFNINIYAQTNKLIDYQTYISKYSNLPICNESIKIEGEECNKAQSYQVLIDFKGDKGKSVITNEEGNITWKFTVKEAGLYNLKVKYFPIEGKSSAIERSILIDSNVPFKEARNVLFDRVWGNATDKIIKDINNNDLRPRQVEKPEWRETFVKDYEGFYNEPYSFYLTKGEHTITFISVKEPVIIDFIQFTHVKKIPFYKDLLKEYNEKGYKEVKDVFVKVQAENAVKKSSPTLYPLNDRTSPLTEPYHYSKIRMNAIGGYNWRMPGDWITWEVEVPEDGLYRISAREKQNFLRGIFATRSLLIDGEIPFQEASKFSFIYDKNWEIYTFENDIKKPYLFYFTKGKHEITMQVTLGDLGDIIQETNKSLKILNDLYRRIIMITGNVPDPFRDYQLDKQIPDLINILKEQNTKLEDMADKLETLTGEKSDQTSILSKLSYQLKTFVDKPDTIPRRLDNFKGNISALGSWIIHVKEQPLLLDYLILSSADAKMPRIKATFWENFKNGFYSFLASFTEDYNALGSTTVEKGNQSIKVWVGTGRDQANVLRMMIDEMFTPFTSVNVDLQLVDQNTLLPATLAGQGPDVAMQVRNDIPVNYAMRNAVYDLTNFSDFDDVTKRFRNSAIRPYEYNKGVYALPDMQTFPMLFYRKDIMKELGLKVPETWDDVTKIIPELQKHNLEFYLELSVPNYQDMIMRPNPCYSAILYQKDGVFYKDNGKKSGLDSEKSMEAFKLWTDFYTSYKFPVTSNFVNRFRTGEMPIGIIDYTLYNTLSVFAPEIRGEWEFKPIPGIKITNEDIRREVASTGLATVMLNNSKDKQSAWKFMKWWMSKDAQVRFGREMEGILGAAARYPTANIKALKELPWPSKDYKALDLQWKWVKGVPEVPGGYLTGRYLDNAFREVIDKGTNPREALYDYVQMINEEIKIKRKEFNLDN